MSDHNIKVSSIVPISAYLRILANKVIEGSNLSRADIEELTRRYEAERIPDSSEKRLMSRVRNYLSSFYGKTNLDWALLAIFFRILRVHRIKLSVTLFYEDGENKTFSVETSETLENPNDATIRNTGTNEHLDQPLPDAGDREIPSDIREG
jgi:hypothetical protein